MILIQDLLLFKEYHKIKVVRIAESNRATHVDHFAQILHQRGANFAINIM